MEEYTVREEGVTGHRIVRNWPEAMFAELATNCVLHKEYGQRQYIGIYVYRDQISFVNHNRPLPPVTIDDLRTKEQFNDRNYLNDEIKEMFFALDLIESYGSGIRRAKRAMKENGNPELIFRPENDIDNYLEVIAPVNPEFARMRDEEEAREKDATQEIAQEIAQENVVNVAEQVLTYLKEHPHATAKDIDASLGLGYDKVRYQLRTLRAAGAIRREGSTKNGMWIVNE